MSIHGRSLPIRKKRDVDMTEGNITRHIISFALPLLIGNLFQQLYNTVDTWVVGNYVSNEAYSAVGTVGPIINMLIGFFLGLSSGAGVVISQYYGARQHDKVQETVHTAILMTLIIGVVFTAIGIVMIPLMLKLINMPATVIGEATTYLSIYFAGLLGLMLYNIGAGIIRAVGDSQRPFYFLVVCAVLNTVLDLLFVLVFHMGVAGVALATVISQGISAVFCYWKLDRMSDIFDMGWRQMKLIPSMAGRILKIGIPSGITQAIMATAGMVVLNLTNAMGKTVVACNVIVMRVDGFAMMPNMTFGQAMSVYTGQNVGAGKYDRVTKGVKQGGILAASFSAAITMILLIFSPTLFGFFTETESLIDLATRMIRIMAVGYICISVTQVLGGVMRGAGDTVTPMWVSIISTIIIRVPTAYILAYLTRTPEFPHGKPIALFGSLVISWTLGMIISVIVFSLGRWKKKMYGNSIPTHEED